MRNAQQSDQIGDRPRCPQGYRLTIRSTGALGSLLVSSSLPRCRARLAWRFERLLSGKLKGRTQSTGAGHSRQKLTVNSKVGYGACRAPALQRNRTSRWDRRTGGSGQEQAIASVRRLTTPGDQCSARTGLIAPRSRCFPTCTAWSRDGCAARRRATTSDLRCS